MFRFSEFHLGMQLATVEYARNVFGLERRTFD